MAPGRKLGGREWEWSAAVSGLEPLGLYFLEKDVKRREATRVELTVGLRVAPCGGGERDKQSVMTASGYWLLASLALIYRVIHCSYTSISTLEVYLYTSAVM